MRVHVSRGSAVDCMANSMSEFFQSTIESAPLSHEAQEKRALRSKLEQGRDDVMVARAAWVDCVGILDGKFPHDDVLDDPILAPTEHLRHQVLATIYELGLLEEEVKGLHIQLN